MVNVNAMLAFTNAAETNVIFEPGRPNEDTCTGLGCAEEATWPFPVYTLVSRRVTRVRVRGAKGASQFGRVGICPRRDGTLTMKGLQM